MVCSYLTFPDKCFDCYSTFPSGMEEVSLYTYLKQCHLLVKIVFPSEGEREISVKDVKDRMSFEDKHVNIENSRTAEFFETYMEEIHSRNVGE